MMRREMSAPMSAPPPRHEMSRNPSGPQPGPGSYYYSTRGSQPSQQPSPSHHMQHNTNTARRVSSGPSHQTQQQLAMHSADDSPSYHVDHLATFAVGKQFGLQYPQDGVRKLKHMEKNSAIWAQPMILRFRPTTVSVEDENGDLVEQFPLELVEQPTAHIGDQRDAYNNMLLFVVREDNRGKRSANPTEMHIFQCERVPATEVAEDLNAYIRGQFRRVRNGRRGSVGGSAGRLENGFDRRVAAAATHAGFGDDASISSDSSEMFEKDVNTLNRCFDDIERFVAQIQSAALAQRELEAQAHRYRTAQRRDKRAPQPDPGILRLRSQLPNELAFVDVLKKFKLSFNLLAKLKSHIHEPNAPELLHFLFTPLTVILDACHWGLGRNIAPQIAAPLLSLEARELMQNCLTSKEADVWMSLGESWRTPPEDWVGQLPPAYRPLFSDGYAPYGLPEPTGTLPQPIRRHVSEPPQHFQQMPAITAPQRNGNASAPGTPATQRYQRHQQQQQQQSRMPPRHMSVDNLDLDSQRLERERIEFERMKIREREHIMRDKERRLAEEEARLEAQRRLLENELRDREMREQRLHNGPSSQPSPQPQRPFAAESSGAAHISVRDSRVMERERERGGAATDAPLPPAVADAADGNPRMLQFVQDLVNRRCKLVQTTYDRVAQNPKELTVSRGEFLEVLNDEKNWWECRNVHSRVGFVPHTILSVIPLDGRRAGGDSPAGYNGGGGFSGPPHSGPAHQAAPEPEVIRPPPPPAPPVPVLRTTVPVSVEVEEPQKEAKLQIHRIKPHEDEVVDELKLKLHSPGERPRLPNRAPMPQVLLNDKSSISDLQDFLKEKGFSVRTQKVLEGTDGAAAFCLDRKTLEDACGPVEGKRLYSQILLQKKHSGYRTHTGAELKAILNVRKSHVELRNEAATAEPEP